MANSHALVPATLHATNPLTELTRDLIMLAARWDAIHDALLTGVFALSAYELDLDRESSTRLRRKVRNAIRDHFNDLRVTLYEIDSCLDTT